ncbi:LIMR family protein DDB_G0293610 [Aduncisulcus paluster]|uniref:LIMR family protein DDB_G0293610 n=1 Tax=Aduncisulcus paluster TaxID=2918883 RepID=A0ABQ5KX08_9EUKA|nr:LIMR family protein DDB_G0293610 [Aduncisulcus paluster]|eukprot:gnl/Carplike_NY0171/1267_a1712_888.p1 GENE.gnl/Carplike_NY0171/1267_a1712_888~~gnl/Carplike_NY0171/1267_a1712_888.p1  ORF type:complete len:526 (+),score=90.29 gnl/Carplike_NY0171/1267_a1712_888:42-1619(+)
MNIWLLICSVVVMFLVTIGGIYFVAYFQHEEDKHSSWISKIVVILSVDACFGFVLLLPLDVAMREAGEDSDIMSVIWQITSIVIMLLALVVIPFCYMWYNSYDGERSTASRFTVTIISSIFVIIIFAIFAVTLYLLIGYADLPSISYGAELSDNDSMTAECSDCTSIPSSIQVRMSLPLYCIGLMSFIGYFMFIFFGGIGLVAVPLDWINAFRTRPHPMTKEEQATWTLVFRERVMRMLAVCNAFKAELESTNKIKADDSEEKRAKKLRKLKMNRRQKMVFNQIKQAAILLEKDFDYVMTSRGQREYNPIGYWFKLLGGILTAVVSLMWLLHIILFMHIDPPVSPFLNSVLMYFNNFRFVSTVIYALLAFYLLFCVLKGSIKFGFRFFFFISLHEMEVGNTTMNSMLFNMALMLFSSFSVVQFLNNAFSSYTQVTSAQMIFGTSVSNLLYLRYFFQYADFVLYGVAFITLIYLIMRPHDKSSELELEEEMEKSGKLEKMITGKGGPKKAPSKYVPKRKKNKKRLK